MGKRLYIGNLSFSTTDDELRSLFETHGELESVSVIEDRETGRSRGFGFVEYVQAEAADKAIQALDGQDFGGRSLRVSEARERSSGGGRGGPRQSRPRY